MIEHVKRSIDNAISHKSKLTKEILSLEGMSSIPNRHLLNNLADMPGLNYLEIGVYTGSTFIATLFGNKFNSAYAIDNWCQFNGNPNTFKRNCEQFGVNDYVLLEGDSFNPGPIAGIKDKINMYFYDGDHELESSRMSLTYYYPVMADEFIFVVDDFDWWTTEDGVKLGIEEVGLDVLYEKHLRSNSTNDNDTWWNGIYVSILKKNGCNKG